jgi:hypothetical protein
LLQRVEMVGQPNLNLAGRQEITHAQAKIKTGKPTRRRTRSRQTALPAPADE